MEQVVYIVSIVLSRKFQASSLKLTGGETKLGACSLWLVAACLMSTNSQLPVDIN